MKSKKIIIIILLFCVSRIAYSSDDLAGTNGSVFMKIPSGSARVQGLGNNGSSLVEGTDAMNINPAGIATAQMKEFNFSYISWFADYSGKYVSYVEPIGQSVIGLNLSYLALKDLTREILRGYRKVLWI